jgi:hypothetical protein
MITKTRQHFEKGWDPRSMLYPNEKTTDVRLRSHWLASETPIFELFVTVFDSVYEYHFSNFHCLR